MNLDSYDVKRPFDMRGVVKDNPTLKQICYDLNVPIQTYVYCIFYKINLENVLCKHCRINYPSMCRKTCKPKTCCSVRCSNRSRKYTPLSPESAERKREKLRIRGLEKDESGLTLNQRRSIKGGITAKANPDSLRRRTEKAIATKQLKRRAREENYQKRLSRLEGYFGIVRFCVLLCKTNDKKRKVEIKSFFKSIFNTHNPTTLNFNMFYYKFILNKTIYNNCVYCNEKYTKYDVGEALPVFNSERYCSNVCSLKDNALSSKKMKELTTRLWEDESYRKLQQDLLHERWANKTVCERREWAQKVLNTLGSEGILRRTEKAIQTKIERSLIIPSGSLDANIRDEYYNKVWRITKQNDLNSLDNFDRRGRLDLREDAHHLDHIFPISRGFILGIPPELIGHIDNLQFIPALVNQSKFNTVSKVPHHIQRYINENKIIISESL